MNRNHFFFFSLLLIVTVLEMAHAGPVSMYERKLRFDRDVVTQINESLEQLVDQRSYKIQVSSEFDRQKQWQTQQVVDDQQGYALSGGTAAPSGLPGFSDLKDLGPPNSVRNQKTAVTYEEIDQLKSLTIFLFVEQGIPPESLKIIEDYLQKNWIEPWPDIVKVVKKDVVFPKNEKEEAQESMGFLTREALLWLAAFLAIMLLALLLKRGKAQTDFNINTQPTSEAKQGGISKEEEQLNIYKEKFIDEVISGPLYARSYLQSLSHDQVSLLQSYFHDSFIRGFFEQWTNSRGDETHHETNLKIAPLAQFLSELCEYKKLREKQVDLPLGYLADLSPQEISEILITENMETLGIVMRYLPRQKIQVMLAQLSQENQAVLLNELQADKVADEKILMGVDARLRAHYKRIAGKILLASWTGDRLTEVLLDNSQYGHLLAGDLIKKNPQLKKRLLKFTLGFADLHLQEKPVIQRILGELNNEVILHALQDMDEQFKDKIYQSISTERGKVLQGLARSIGKTSTQVQIQEARAEIVRRMRQVLYS